MHWVKRALLTWILMASPLLAGEWRSLWNGRDLEGWIKAPFGGSGDVEVTDGVLVLQSGLLTGVNYTNKLPAIGYEVEMEARRVIGNDFFCGLTFPVKDSFATLIVGGWGGSVVGISSIDGNDAAHNETTLHRRFEAGRWYTIRLKVTEGRLEVWLDGDPVINVNIAGRKISLRPGDIELSKPFGIATYSTAAEYRKIRFREVTAGGGAAAASNPSPVKP